MVEQSHVFNLRRALRDRSASQELAGGSIPRLYVGFLGVFNSNVTTKFVQLHYFYHKKKWGTKILYPFLSKLWGTCPSRPS